MPGLYTISDLNYEALGVSKTAIANKWTTSLRSFSMLRNDRTTTIHCSKWVQV